MSMSVYSHAVQGLADGLCPEAFLLSYSARCQKTRLSYEVHTVHQ